MRLQQGKWDACAPTSAEAFVPSKDLSTKLTIGSPDGVEMTIDTFTKYSPQSPTVPILPASPVVISRRTTSIRIESKEAKWWREEARSWREEARCWREEALRKEQERKEHDAVCEMKAEGSASKLTSEERFALSPGPRSTLLGGTTLQFNRSPMVCTHNKGHGHPIGSNNRGDPSKISLSHHGQGYGSSSVAPILCACFELVAPMEMSANRWVPTSSIRKAQPDVDTPEMVVRKVKALLNKLTMERFDSISDQIIQWANKGVNEKDGRMLIQVVRLVFEKATDEAAWSEMYARLCRKMLEQISPDVQDDGIKNPGGKPIAGGLLFRKYLLNRCQEDFERGWFTKEATAAVAVVKLSDDQATKVAKEKCQGDFERGWLTREAIAAAAASTAKAPDDQATKDTNEKKGSDEAELYSDEHYAAQKAKRQGLGLIKFIGELFKLQMLTERIMHECVKKLLGNVENPEEEEIESLCQLLKTVGQLLDTPKARAYMDVYFMRMKELGKSTNVSSRMQFMLQDIIELRERKWVSRNAVAAPMTIAAVHEAAAKDRAAAEKESYNHQASMSRGGDRNQEYGLQPTVEERTPVGEPESAPTDMSEADAKKKIDEDVKEFLTEFRVVRNLEEVDVARVGELFAQADSESNGL